MTGAGVPTTGPYEADRREALHMHIIECWNHDYQCRGFLGDYDTYVCICWCHKEERKA